MLSFAHEAIETLSSLCCIDTTYFVEQRPGSLNQIVSACMHRKPSETWIYAAHHDLSSTFFPRLPAYLATTNPNDTMIKPKRSTVGICIRTLFHKNLTALLRERKRICDIYLKVTTVCWGDNCMAALVAKFARTKNVIEKLRQWCVWIYDLSFYK